MQGLTGRNLLCGERQRRLAASNASLQKSYFQKENPMYRYRRHDYRERPPLYRARDGVIFGICKGIARHLEFPVFWLRVITVVLFIFSGIWPVAIAYVVGALLIKPEPVVPFETEEDQEFYNSYVTSRSMALKRLKRTFDNLDRRIRRMEDIVTARDYDWESRLHE
jgi:phage shock protein C